MIAVGEYVRTNKGISKIIKFIGFENYEVDKNGTMHSDDSFKEFIKKQHILKHSKNIIDLIEVGDYVNGKEIIIIDNGIGGLDKSVVYGYKYGENEFLWNIYEEEIKSIVTKEQFKSIEYKLEDK